MSPPTTWIICRAPRKKGSGPSQDVPPAVVRLEEPLVQTALGWLAMGYPLQYELINWFLGELRYRSAAMGHGIIQQAVGPFILSDAAIDMKSSSSSTSSVAPKDTTSCASGDGWRMAAMKCTGREPAAGD